MFSANMKIFNLPNITITFFFSFILANPPSDTLLYALKNGKTNYEKVKIF